jgi:hypothetical protein
MAVLDYQLEISDDQDVASGTLSSGSAVISTNVIDRGASEVDAFGSSITPDIGEGGELEWNVKVTNEAFAGASAAVVATLVTKASSATITSSGTTIATLTVAATSAIGTSYSVKVPSGTVQRYLGCVYTASGGNLTAGNVSSWINLDHEKID